MIILASNKEVEYMTKRCEDTPCCDQCMLSHFQYCCNFKYGQRSPLGETGILVYDVGNLINLE